MVLGFTPIWVCAPLGIWFGLGKNGGLDLWGRACEGVYSVSEDDLSRASIMYHGMVKILFMVCVYSGRVHGIFVHAREEIS